MPMRSNIALFAIALLLGGCSTPKMLPVNGKVAFADGSDPAPLAGYSVTLVPAKGGESQTAEIEADGHFFLTALPGAYRVSIAPPPPSPDGIPAKPVIDRKYASPESSGLSVLFTPGHPIEIKVAPAAESK
jgi:hypothetical protein